VQPSIRKSIFLENRKMKKIAILLMTVVFCVTNYSCKDKKSEKGYTEFGIHHGECFGNCFKVFKISGTHLYQDTSKQYYTGPFNFQKSIELSDGLYEYAHDMLQNVPEELKGNNSGVYGCPDCYDQGGIYFSLKENGDKSRFSIDPATTADQSQELIDYKVKLNLVLDSLLN